MLKRCELLNELEAKGVRLTAQRRALVETIQQADAHLDAATLLTRARQRDPNIDRATVYRTLELLKRLGLIDELDLMHLNGEKHYYEVKTQKDHLHLACFRCGTIEEFDSPTFQRLKREIAAQNMFQVQVMRLEVGGLCRQCAAAQQKFPDERLNQDQIPAATLGGDREDLGATANRLRASFHYRFLPVRIQLPGWLAGECCRA